MGGGGGIGHRKYNEINNIESTWDKFGGNKSNTLNAKIALP